MFTCVTQVATVCLCPFFRHSAAMNQHVPGLRHCRSGTECIASADTVSWLAAREQPGSLPSCRSVCVSVCVQFVQVSVKLSTDDMHCVSIYCGEWHWLRAAVHSQNRLPPTDDHIRTRPIRERKRERGYRETQITALSDNALRV